MPWVNTAFFAGALGGMSPEIARFLVRAQGGQLADWLERLANEPIVSIAAPVVASIAILLLLALLGGIVAHFGSEPNIGKAFMLGVGAPAFILSTVSASNPAVEVTKQTRVQEQSSGKSAIPEQAIAGMAMVFLTPAYAQTVPPREQQIPGLTLDTTAIAGDCGDCRVVFQDAAGSFLSSEAVAGGGGPITLPVPSAAATAILEGVANTNNAQFSLDALAEAAAEQQGRPLALEITKSRNYVNDFHYLLGNNAIQPFDIELKAKSLEMN